MVNFLFWLFPNKALQSEVCSEGAACKVSGSKMEKVVQLQPQSNYLSYPVDSVEGRSLDLR